MLHAAASADVPVQQPLLGSDGRLVHSVATPEGDRLLRVLTYLPGELLADEDPTPPQAASLGRVGGRLTRSLESFAHPAQDRQLIWDLRRFALVGPWLKQLGEDEDDAADVAARFGDTVLPVLDELPHQVVHSDLSPHNVLVDPTRADYACGIIDFGDVVRTARVFDVAVGMANLLSTDPADPWAKAVAFAQGYSSTRPLSELEVSILAVSSLARVVLRMVVARWRASTEPARREYLLSHSARDAAHLRLAHRAGIAAVTERLHDLVAAEQQGE
jgi:Ser/Thr protein kinase RdoA (MazF antagonist)